MSFRERHFTSEDGLGLYYREYGSGKGEQETVICLPGLTRNCKDFHDIALHLVPRYRVICPDLRGRGQSGRDPNWRNYNITVYMPDVRKLLDDTGVARAIFLGTSLGGLISMTMAYQSPERVRAVILNDIGPEADPAGIERILGYVGRRASVKDWDEAAAQLRDTYAIALPGMPEEFWNQKVLYSYREGESGKPELDMDLKIGDAIRAAYRAAKPLKLLRKLRLVRQVGGVPVDTWDSFRAINVPCLVLRGEISDILSGEIVARMKAAKPDLECVTIPGVGHLPFIEGPEMLGAIDAFLAKLG